jgi:hypothetical protein
MPAKFNLLRSPRGSRHLRGLEAAHFLYFDSRWCEGTLQRRELGVQHGIRLRPRARVTKPPQERHHGRRSALVPLVRLPHVIP